MPGRMLKWRKDMRPATRIIYKDHQRNCSAAKYIEGIITLVQAMEFGSKIVINRQQSKGKKQKRPKVESLIINLGSILDLELTNFKRQQKVSCQLLVACCLFRSVIAFGLTKFRL